MVVETENVLGNSYEDQLSVIQKEIDIINQQKYYLMKVARDQWKLAGNIEREIYWQLLMEEHDRAHTAVS